MIRTVSIVALLALGATYALAQATGGAAISERKALMKETNGLTKQASAMAKGTEPFDLAKAQNWVKVILANETKAMGLYPDDSKEGGETRALPAVWTDREGFKTKFNSFDKAAKAAATAIKDEASFKAEVPKVTETCDACHKDYRAPSKKQ